MKWFDSERRRRLGDFFGWVGLFILYGIVMSGVYLLFLELFPSVRIGLTVFSTVFVFTVSATVLLGFRISEKFAERKKRKENR